MDARGDTVLQIRGVSKSFSGVEVLHGVDLDLAPGERARVGREERGGQVDSDQDPLGRAPARRREIHIEGKSVEALTPRPAQAIGIVTIYQARNLIPHRSVGENILLGDVPVGFLTIVQWGRLFDRATEILANLNLALDPRQLVVNLTPGDQQAVEIAGAVHEGPDRHMGTGFEMNSIGAAVIGGIPLTGGRGNVGGTLTGVLLLGIIANGLNLLHVDASWQYVVTGLIIIIAVIIHEQRLRRR